MRICFVVENATDVRMVTGLAERCALSVVGRPAQAIGIITHPPAVPVTVVTGPASRTKFASYVFQYLNQHADEIDAVLVQGYGLAALAANLICRFVRVPVFMLVCSPVEAYYRCRRVAGDPGRPYRHPELLALSLVAWMNRVVGSRYITLSEYLGQEVGRGRHFDVVPVYGVNSSIFVPPSRPKRAIRADLGLPETGRLIFSSSRIAPEKDSETLLTAFKLLLEGGCDAWLLNRSGNYASLQKTARQMGIEGRLIATDAVHPTEQLPRNYQAADLCVQASREEGLGFSVLEALACGVPVVAASVGGLKETIVEGETGWTYPVGDAPALARQMAAALTDLDEARRRAAAGRALIGAKYDSCVAFDRLMEVIGRSRVRK